MSKIENNMLAVLDCLIEEGGYWTGPDRQVLVTLAQDVHDDDTIDSRDARYKAISAAVLLLESYGMVAVERRTRDEPHQANIIEAIRLL